MKWFLNIHTGWQYIETGAFPKMPTSNSWNLMQTLCAVIISQVPETDEPEVNAMCHYYVTTPEPVFIMRDIDVISRCVLIVLYCIIIAVSFCANMAVIILFLCHKRLRSVHGVFMMSLSLSELLLTSILFTYFFYWILIPL